MRTTAANPVATPAKTNTPFFGKGAGHALQEHTETEPSFFTKKNNDTSFVQAKLTVGQPNDKYEREADAVADKVVQKLSDPQSIQTKPADTPVTSFVQTKCAACEQEERLQKKENNSSEITAPSLTENRLYATKGSGGPLSNGACHYELRHVVQQKGNNTSLQRQIDDAVLSQRIIELEIDRINRELEIAPTGSLEWTDLIDRRSTLMNELMERNIHPGLQPESLALQFAYIEYNKNVIENPPCTNRGPEVDIYTGISGALPVISGNRVTAGVCGHAWCANFVRWCLNQAGVQNSLTARARSIKDWGIAQGLYHDLNGPASIRPIPGDIFYKTPTEEDSTHPCDTNPCVSRGPGSGHVGFILSVSGNTVTTVEGNIHIGPGNDGVTSRTRNMSELDGVLRIPSSFI